MGSEEPMPERNGTTGAGGDRSGTCRDWLLGVCGREACRFLHNPAPPNERRMLFPICHDFQNKECRRLNCKFLHCSVEAETAFLRDGLFPPPLPHRPQLSVRPFNWPPPPPPPVFFAPPEVEGPPDNKYMRFSTEMERGEAHCAACASSEYSLKLMTENYNVLLKKYNELREKNAQLTSMNEFLLEQTTSRERENPIAMTSRASAPVSLATVSVTPVVSLSELVPAAAPASLALEAATSRPQILTQAPQLLTVSTTQPLMTNSGALIVTSTGAHQLMQASAPATLVGGGRAVVAVTPAQLVANSSSATVQQLVQHSAQLAVAQQSAQHLAVAQQSAQHLAAAQQSAQHLEHLAAEHLAAAQQSAQHLEHLAAAQQSAQHLAAAAQQSQHLAAAQQSAQHLAAAQQSAQHLAAAQQSAQHLAAAQQSAQHLAAAAQQSQHLAAAQQSAQHLAASQAQHLSVPSSNTLVHASSAQITISSAPQLMTQAPTHFPMISQSILPH